MWNSTQKTNVENVLQFINKKYVTVADGDVKQTNPILDKILQEITTALRSESTLFNRLFETYLYGGSMYDGLKVSKPDEFDIDLKLYLPEILDAQIKKSDRDGFVYVKLKDWNRLVKDKCLYEIYRDLEKLKDKNNYLSQQKIKSWMQGIVTKAVNYIQEEKKLDDIQLTYRTSGPAITLNATYNNHNMDIDLVAVFRIPGKKWPVSPVRQNNNTIWRDFLVVPKPPKDVLRNERYWRLSFPEQEKQMIKNLYFCKPVLRLLKKLRDTKKHNIPSYFIKTIFLWEIENRDSSFWETSLRNVFLCMLEVYEKYLESSAIPYYWSSNNNFLQHLKDSNIINIKNCLSNMIKDIHRLQDSDPFVVAKHLLPDDELDDLRSCIVSEELVQSTSNFFEAYEEESDDNRSTNFGYSNGTINARSTQQTSTFSSGDAVKIGAAIGIGAAIVGGIFAISKLQRNRNN